MKILIWVLCLLVNIIVTVILNINGISLGPGGAALLYLAAASLAFILCRVWDKYHKPSAKHRDTSSEEDTSSDL